MLTEQRLTAQIMAARALNAVNQFNINSDKLPSIDSVLEREDSLVDLRRELEHYQVAQGARVTCFVAYKAMAFTGLTEAAAINIFVPNPDKPENSYEDASSALEEYIFTTDLKKASHNKTLYSNMNKSMKRQMFYEDDEEDPLILMVRKMGLSVADFFKESIRVRQAHIELLCMQIEWLKKKNRAEKQNRQKAQLEAQRLVKEKKKKGKVSPVEVAKETEAPVVAETQAAVEKPKVAEEPFVLEGWQLYTTKEFWSRDPKDLVSLPSGSRAETVAAYKGTTAGSISVKPQSVVRAVEFCVSGKDVLTKSLDTRLRHGSRELREWIRLRRGHDRVGIYVPSVDQKVAIFFSGPRSVVYKNLKY